MKKESVGRILTKEEQTRLNRKWYDQMARNDDELIEDLKRHFRPHSLIKKDNDGKVDPYATVAACGAYEVYSYIEQRIELGEQGK